MATYLTALVFGLRVLIYQDSTPSCITFDSFALLVLQMVIVLQSPKLSTSVRRSSWFNALEQMLVTKQRLDKLAAMRVDFTRQGMLEAGKFMCIILINYWNILQGTVSDATSKPVQLVNSRNNSEGDANGVPVPGPKFLANIQLAKTISGMFKLAYNNRQIHSCFLREIFKLVILPQQSTSHNYCRWFADFFFSNWILTLNPPLTPNHILNIFPTSTRR